jgi:hypothetical protein
VARRSTDGAGECALIAAVLRQAMLDMHARRREVRQAAVAFWADARAVGFWADLLDCDVAQLQRAVQRGAGGRQAL